MEQRSFDRLARALAASGSRRSLSALLGVVVSWLAPGPGSPGAGSAKKHKHRKNQQNTKRRQKGKVRVEGPCGNGSGKANRCKRDSQCCTNHCDKKKGRCRCLTLGQACDSDRLCCPGRTGRSCRDGRCQATPECDNSCAGCCDGQGTCQPGTEPDACGGDGASCQACTAGETCEQGACQPAPTCAESCDGCCDAEGVCQPGTAQDACGTGGAACVACTGVDTCGGDTPGVCGCVPTTCQATGAECGTIPDGCGDTLPCGNCPAEQVCWENACVCGDVCESGCQFSSVQDAIDEADPDDTIRLCAETYQETIAISKNLTLLGAGDGEDGTILDGQQSGRVVFVAAGLTVALQGLRITGGQISEQSVGGGIYNNDFSGGGTLTLTDCTVSGNTAGFSGGGIGNDGTLTLTNCTVSENSAGGVGGGIYNLGTVTLEAGTTVTANHADVVGGGIYNDGTVGGGTSTCSADSDVSGNTAGDPPVPSDCVADNGGDCGAC